MQARDNDDIDSVYSWDEVSDHDQQDEVVTPSVDEVCTWLNPLVSGLIMTFKMAGRYTRAEFLQLLMLTTVLDPIICRLGTSLYSN